MPEFVPLAATIALVYAVGNFIKQIQGGEHRHAVTQFFIWAVAVFAVLLLGESDFAAGVQVGDLALSEVNVWSKVLFGLFVGSSANVLYDVLPTNTPTLGEKRPEG